MGPSIKDVRTFLAHFDLHLPPFPQVFNFGCPSHLLLSMRSHFDYQKQETNIQKRQHYLQNIRLLLTFTPSLTLHFPSIGTKSYYTVIVLSNTKPIFIFPPIPLVGLNEKILESNKCFFTTLFCVQKYNRSQWISVLEALFSKEMMEKCQIFKQVISFDKILFNTTFVIIFQSETIYTITSSYSY